MEMNARNQKAAELCKALLDNAELILIGAGAGMSAAAGIDYTDSQRFARLFPEMAKKGFTNNYELFGYEGLSDAVMWGYHAMHIQHVSYDIQTDPAYQNLFNLVKDKDYFVVTSNVDRMFHKNNFDPKAIFTPQGDYRLMQCLTPCSDQVWDTRPFLDRLLAALDPVTHEITDPSAIPVCPKCGGKMFMNVRGGSWFIEKPYKQQNFLFSEWVEESFSDKLLVIELGAGFNTPGVVRYPLEKITNAHPDSNMIRINKEHPELPSDIAKKSIGIQEDIGVFLEALQ
jgi:NAD-dependent SIR2 family protein deacetylase